MPDKDAPTNAPMPSMRFGRLVREHQEAHPPPPGCAEMAMEFEDDDNSDDDSGLEELLT